MSPTDVLSRHVCFAGGSSSRVLPPRTLLARHQTQFKLACCLAGIVFFFFFHAEPLKYLVAHSMIRNPGACEITALIKRVNHTLNVYWRSIAKNVFFFVFLPGQAFKCCGGWFSGSFELLFTMWILLDSLFFLFSTFFFCLPPNDIDYSRPCPIYIPFLNVTAFSLSF